MLQACSTCIEPQKQPVRPLARGHNGCTPDTGLTHEFVVLKTDLSADKLPVKNGQVSESQFKKMGGVQDIEPGKNKRLTLKLVPGRYVLICNKPGHYAMGLHTSLLVTP
jgi:uncharacterized cupredoxin-like copper-binding protein